MRRMLALMVSMFFGMALMACSEGTVTGTADAGSVNASSSSATTSNFNVTFPVAFTTPSMTCPDGRDVEAIAWQGTNHLVGHVTMKDGELVRFVAHQDLRADGTGQETGAAYEFTETQDITHNNLGEPPITFTNQAQAVARSKVGDIRVALITAIFRVTVDATGVLAADLNKFKVRCPA